MAWRRGENMRGALHLEHSRKALITIVAFLSASLVSAALGFCAALILSLFLFAPEPSEPLKTSEPLVPRSLFYNGSRIVVALEVYEHDHDQYPAELSALVPDYLPEIGLPGWGANHWYYETSDDRSEFDFGVTIMEEHYAGHHYWGREKYWYYDGDAN